MSKHKESTPPVKVRTRWDRLRRVVIEATPPEKALTQQQFKDDCDMNRIVKNAERGIPPRFRTRGEPHYGDYSEVPLDLAAMYDQIERAEEAFMQLPAQLRLELNNDPRNIGNLTKEQAERYRLTKTLPAEPVGNPPSQPAPTGAAEAAPKKPAKAGGEPSP